MNVYSSNAARDAAITSPEAGQYIYNSAAGGVQVYNGTFWRTTGKSVLYDIGVDAWLDAGRVRGVVEGGGVSPWVDRSGNAYAASEATNPPTLNMAGLEYPELYFNGVNSSLTLPKSSFQNSLTALTVQVYLQWPAGANDYVLGRYDSSTGNRGWAIKFDNVDSRWEVVFATDPQGGGIAEISYASTAANRDIRNTGFHTVGFVWDGSTDPGTMSLTLDGAYISTIGSGIDAGNQALYDSAADITIGHIIPLAANICEFDLRHVAIFNRRLAAAELSAIHHEWSHPSEYNHL